MAAWGDDTCLAWLWRERFSRDGARARCASCERERRFHRIRQRRAYACDTCGRQIYPAAGTPFRRSRTPLAAWFRLAQLLVADGEKPTVADLAGALRVDPATTARMRRRLLAALAAGDEQADMLRRIGAAYGGVVDRPDAPRSARPAADRQAAIDRIRAAACHTFAARGVDATRVADIAREAGVSVGIVHYYFDSKADVLVAALAWAGEQIERRLDDVTQAPASALEQLAAMLRLSLPEAGLLGDELLLWLEAWVRARHRPALAESASAISRAWHERMTAVVARGVSEGSMAPVAAPALVAQRLIALANDLGFKSVVGHQSIRREDLDAFAAEQLGVSRERLALAIERLPR